MFLCYVNVMFFRLIWSGCKFNGTNIRISFEISKFFINNFLIILVFFVLFGFLGAISALKAI